MQSISRRHILSGAAALVGSGIVEPDARADQRQGLLTRLQAAKKVRVGIANQPPFSALNPDGSLTGVAPTIAKAVMTRLGIPNVEGSIASYGQLIPGMQAGRWDFVAASLTITKARCEQVLFSDPLVLEGAAIVALKDAPQPIPDRIADLAKLDAPVGVEAGGADLRAVIAAGVSPSNVRQFPNDPVMMDGLIARRVRYVVVARSALRAVMERRHLDVLIKTPIADLPVHGSGCAFRKTDVELHAAFQKELRAMKASGEFFKIVREFGFDTSPELLHATDRQACKA